MCRIVLVITIKNERKLLRQNILYHHYLGVEHFYIFFDGTNDGSEETILDLPYVSRMSSIQPYLYEGHNEIKEFLENHSEHHVARQCLNVYHVQQISKKAGYDWLISLDADEMLCVDLQHSYPRQLIDFFMGIDHDIEMVRFSTFEIVQQKGNFTNIFEEATLFKKPGAKLKHKVYDPSTNKILKLRGFYGQTMGKAAIRTNIPAKHRTTHKFVRLDDSDLRRTWQGYCLHYYGYDFEDFIKKYQNFRYHPDTWISGNNVEYIKLLWRNMVNRSDMSDEEMRNYYERWVLYQAKEISKLSRNKFLGVLPKEPQLMEIHSVRNAFLNMHS